MQQKTRLNPPNQILKEYEPNHAIFETLQGPNLIERFDVYRSPQNNDNELISVHIKLGSKLNGHPKIIHGGIIALLFDEAMGWARGVLLKGMYVTANLNVDYRSPFTQDSEAVLRVFYQDGTKEKMTFRGVLERDGTVFSEATGLLVRVRSKI